MSDFGTLQDTIAEETHLPNESAAIKRHIVAALRYLKPYRFKFSEKSGSFSTVAGQAAYTPGTGGVPSDIMKIDSIRQQNGVIERPLRRVTIQEMRELQYAGAASGQSDIWAWHANKIVLWPTPSAVFTINLDYQFDATLNAANGAEITTASADTVTNDFFVRGEELLRARAIYTLCMGSSQDLELASSMKLLFDEVFSSLRYERDIRYLDGMQARGYF